MRRRLLVPALFAVLVSGAVAAGPSSATTAPGSAPAVIPAGLPDGVPPAATRAEPTLPVPKGWPFPESFPRTSGTGRLGGGAAFWSDFVYDDHGATAGTDPTPIANLAPTDGSFTYPDGPAKKNGADIFRAAVGLDSAASYWRIDWNTLIDPKVPIAAWTFDTDRNAATGATAWPAAAGARSPGIDRALVVSSRGARVVTGSGAVLAALPTTVDTASRSFVVRVPRTVLPVTGTWKVRLAAGLANPTGTAFAPVLPTNGALLGQPSIYNVTFRTSAQEPPVSNADPITPQLPGGGGGLLRAVKYGNFWMEDGQAKALTSGDVSAFSMPLDWAALAAKRASAEPRPTGWSNRWYVSSLGLGQGVVANSPGAGDLRPNFLGRIQPYGVYVPTSYDPAKPTPLTWVLHSLGVNHNQYSALGPKFLQGLCEQRKSICATTLGYGPDGWYFDEAENDFWSVWRSVGKAYRLDPERTVISGYSMGGYASYKLGLSYPDLFAKAMPLAGPPACGVRVGGPVEGPAGSGRCTTEGSTTALVPNAREVPYVLADGVLDELVPYSSVRQQVDAFDQAGLRYHFETYPAEDHLVYATQDGFSSVVSQIGDARRTRNPGTVDYRWYPNLSRADLGIGTTGDYWVRQPVARNAAAGSQASVLAVSGMRPEPAHTVVKSQSANVPGDPSPDLVEDSTWSYGATPLAKPTLTLQTGNVSRLTVDMARAGFRAGQVSTIASTTDGAVALRLLHLAPHARVRIGSATVYADGAGTVAVTLPGGTSTVRIG